MNEIEFPYLDRKISSDSLEYAKENIWYHLLPYIVAQTDNELQGYIRKEKMKFESYCDIIGIYPQIWFKDENDEMSWIYVIYSTNGKFSNVSKELDKLITGMPQFNGYIAQVGLACAEKDGPYRGAGFYIKFNGIEKIYSAHRDTGHGYGIEIKIK